MIHSKIKAQLAHPALIRMTHRAENRPPPQTPQLYSTATILQTKYQGYRRHEQSMTTSSSSIEQKVQEITAPTRCEANTLSV